jgi:hypothetical protein
MPRTTHISTKDLERYLLNRLQEPELGWVEEHLLWCQECQNGANGVQRFIDLVRAGLIRGGFEVELLAEELKPKPRTSPA